MNAPRTKRLERPVVQRAGGRPGNFLVVVKGHEAGRLIEISTDELVVGRGEDCALRLTDAGVSTRHCVIKMTAGEVMVRDLGSRNGTYVDGTEIGTIAALSIGSVLQVGDTVLRYDFRSRKEVEEVADLKRAARYVESLLPDPIQTGPVQTDWSFVPSSWLGGDAFGYHMLDADRMAVYLLDVCGHGIGAALHSVAAVHALRLETLPDTDFSDPGAVLRGLNAVFPMEKHGGLSFTIWYGVYGMNGRTLSYAAAGHPPALLRSSERRDLQRLQACTPPIGILENLEPETQSVVVPVGSRLFLFSDGVFEFVTRVGRRWNYEAFQALLEQSDFAASADDIREGVLAVASGAAFSDDFSLLVLRFS